MIEKWVNKTKIYNEFDGEQNKYFFDLKTHKFLHQIDSFYYSVKVDADFMLNTFDERVINVREFFKKEIEKISLFDNTYVCEKLPSDLILQKSSIAGMYNIHLKKQDMFDIFFASVVPSDDTTQIHVQIRSQYLWLYGAKIAYDKSLEKVQELLKIFDFNIVAVNENRVDFCWHTNYVQDPSRFLDPKKIANQRVSTLGRDGDIHLEFDGNNDYTVDYFRFGRLKSNNLIFRIYLKSKEVVEQGYKSFFFKIWLMNGLINRYDLYVYEECYKRQNFGYMDKARLKFYCEFGTDNALKYMIERDFLDENKNPDYDTVKKLADALTPKVTLILNFEFQTMRKFSSSINFINFKGRKGVSERIYTYLDNRKLIIDYLTSKVFRLVDYDQTRDTNKSRCKNTAFWDRLCNTKLIDTYINIHGVKLVREYSNNIDSQLVKSRVLGGLATLNLYQNGLNDSNLSDDLIDFLCCMNDNDIHSFRKIKHKKSRQIRNRLDGVAPVQNENNYLIIDKKTGEVI